MAIELFVEIITKDTAVGSEYIAGSGPVVNIERWNSSLEMDAAGRFSFACEATATNLALIQRLRKVRCYALLAGVLTEIGNGIIQEVNVEISAQRVVLSINGSDMLYELSYKTVGRLALSDTIFSVNHATALGMIDDFAPTWTMTASPSPVNDYAYHKYSGDSVLAALNYLVKMNSTHFRLTGFRTLEFRATANDTGLVAGNQVTNPSANSCSILSLRRVQSANDFITRLYPYGAGGGGQLFTLATCTRSAPAGYELSVANNYIRHIDYETNIDTIERYAIYNQIAPYTANRYANAETAANTLFDVALYDLKQRIALFESSLYTVRLASCPLLLRPLDSIYISFSDPETGLIVNGSMWVIKSAISVDRNGVQTTEVTVSDQLIQEKSEADIWMDTIRTGQAATQIRQYTDDTYSVDMSGYIDTVTPRTITANLPADTTFYDNVRVYARVASGSFAMTDLETYFLWSHGPTGVNAWSPVYSIGNGWYSRPVGGVGYTTFQGETLQISIRHAGVSLVGSIEAFVVFPVTRT
ncbi:MAG TPA: hypothetical protein PKD12_15695 [Nitrospira sp.]|nr:hypothetical protein [Nitrospira sp.]